MQQQIEYILYILNLIFRALGQFIVDFYIVIFLIVVSTILVLRYLMAKTKHKIITFRRGTPEIIDSQETVDTVFGYSKLKKKLVVFLKEKDVFPFPLVSFRRLTHYWVTIEGYPHVINMMELQDIAKKTINEEFLALYKQSMLPDIVSKVLKAKLKQQLTVLLAGLCIGVLVGFLLSPVYLLFFEFI
jgi:hypothetical protein